MSASETLLVELLTEELPPRALPKLGESFGSGVSSRLRTLGLAREECIHRWFATPRRLAIVVPNVRRQAATRQVAEKVMPVSVAFDANGEPSAALMRKLDAKGIPLDEIERFERRMDGKSAVLFRCYTAPGAMLDECLAASVNEAIAQLPIPKLMRWGSGDAQFVRPVHRVVMLHGDRVVPGQILGLEAGNATLGHRFMSKGEIVFRNADEYEQRLLAEGMVVPDFAKRRAEIEFQLQVEARGLNASLGEYTELLDEVTALVEHPSVYVGAFESEFLAVPQECLTLTMRQNQKYFPLFDSNGKLLSRFLVVSNMKVRDPRRIVEGNQRVVRPRFADARFFFDQDRRVTLESRVTRLKGVVFHNKLGTQLMRVERIKRLAARIARRLHADIGAAERAAWLAKADLLTDMVAEFPELQGVMGRYYARHDGEADSVADAIEMHYRPRFAGDALPTDNVARAVAIADKVDALVGFFGIDQVPTGEKDPFGLRRSALGVLRILSETPLPLDLRELIGDAAESYPEGMLRDGANSTLYGFMLERLRNMLRESGHHLNAIEAVLAGGPGRIDLVIPRLEAVREFVALPEAAALAAANKRIVNILRKADEDFGDADVALFQDEAERALFNYMNALAPSVESSVVNEDYGGALKALAGLRGAVDTFFDEVLVMVDEPLTRRNRLALLSRLSNLMNRVADISRLAVER